MASSTVGMRGTSMSKTFEGMCVKTIVLSKPKRLAMRAAERAEMPARMLAAKKMVPTPRGQRPIWCMNQYTRGCSGR